ncbi:unnamed protein product, partial [Rotaria sp. Silwood2]
YHQQLEHALAQEVENREWREIEKQRILEIKRDTRSYWGTNALAASYREIEIHPDFPEFNIINELLNSTIESHGNEYGTIYGKDPTELENSESSKYLKDYPLLVPLLDTNANEYWLFHGTDADIIPFLLLTGYDPRISSLNGMFRGGFYLAENSSKSNQYIPCPGCRKNAIFYESGCSCTKQEDLEFSIILYRAVLGDLHIAKKYKKETYRGKDKHRVCRPPYKPNSCNLYDSVMGESKKYGGDKLEYREFILYESAQAYTEYVIKFKRSAANIHAPSNMQQLNTKWYNFLQNTYKLRPE